MVEAELETRLVISDGSNVVDADVNTVDDALFNIVPGELTIAVSESSLFELDELEENELSSLFKFKSAELSFDPKSVPAVVVEELGLLVSTIPSLKLFVVVKVLTVVCVKGIDVSELTVVERSSSTETEANGGL